jgi:hypothetical protein
MRCSPEMSLAAWFGWPVGSASAECRWIAGLMVWSRRTVEL